LGRVLVFGWLDELRTNCTKLNIVHDGRKGKPMSVGLKFVVSKFGQYIKSQYLAEHSKHVIDAIEIRVKSIGKIWASQPSRSGGKGLDHPPLMTPVQSQAETVFSFSEILFHM
jgi:hypothetical protein